MNETEVHGGDLTHYYQNEREGEKTKDRQQKLMGEDDGKTRRRVMTAGSRTAAAAATRGSTHAKTLKGFPPNYGKERQKNESGISDACSRLTILT